LIEAGKQSIQNKNFERRQNYAFIEPGDIINQNDEPYIFPEDELINNKPAMSGGPGFAAWNADNLGTLGSYQYAGTARADRLQNAQARVAERAKKQLNRIQMAKQGYKRAKMYADAAGNVVWGQGRYRRGFRRRRYRRRGRYGRRYRRGRGFYSGFLGDAGEALGGLVGTRFGMPGLGALGRAGGSWLARKIGRGAYGDAGSTIGADPPLMANWGEREGCIRIVKREYLMDIISPNSGFNKLFEQPINPGNPNIFPWMRNIAINFETYRINSMIFSYESTSGEGTNTAIGQVQALWINDPHTSTPTNKVELEQRALVGSARADEPGYDWAVECDPNIVQNDWERVRTEPDNQFTKQDLKEMDHGRFCLFVSGIPGTNTNIGKLWVTYEIELQSPIQPPPVLTNWMFHIETMEANASADLTSSTASRISPVAAPMQPNAIQRNGIYPTGMDIVVNPINPFTGVTFPGVYLVIPPGTTHDLICFAGWGAYTGDIQKTVRYNFNNLKLDPNKQIIQGLNMFYNQPGYGTGWVASNQYNGEASAENASDSWVLSCHAQDAIRATNNSSTQPMYVGVQYIYLDGGASTGPVKQGNRFVKFMSVKSAALTTF